MIEWCEHIKWTMFHGGMNWSFQGYAAAVIKDFEDDPAKKRVDWLFCPICAAPRPVSRKTLEEVLMNTYHEASYGSDVFKKQAVAAKSFVSEILSGHERECRCTVKRIPRCQPCIVNAAIAEIKEMLRIEK